LALLKRCVEKIRPHLGLLVLDSPLLAYWKPEGEEDNLTGTHVDEYFYRWAGMGHMVAAGWIGRATVEGRLFNAAATCGLVKDDGQRSVLATIKSGLDAGEKEPHTSLPNREQYCVPNDAEPFDDGDPKFRNGKANGSSRFFKDGDANDKATLQSARASTFTMEAIEWLWPNRFALGKLGLIVGLPEEGKGQLLCYIAAQVTRPDGRWPCDEGGAPNGKVVLLTAEDSPSDTVVPRLAAAGADLDRIEIVKMVSTDDDKNRMFSLVTDLDLLRQKIIEVGNVKVVQIDPITAYLGHGKMDSFRTTDVRAILAPLVELAAELDVAIIAIMHFNKKTDVTNALLRISDSLAFGATARHVYAVVDDTENRRKLFVRAKNNLAPNNNETLAFHFGARKVGIDSKTGKEIWAPYVIWEPQHVDITAVEAMQAATKPRSTTARDDAKEFLLDLLANGPVRSREIIEAAEANGISRRTLFRAKNDLGIKPRKKGVRGGWFWQLPEQPTP
jgi:AAA domain